MKQDNHYLIAAYDAQNASISRIRARIFLIVQNFVLGAFAISGFLVAAPSISLSQYQAILATLAIVAVTLAAVCILNISYKALYSILKIISQIERAMGFHEPGLFLENTALFPQDVASSEVLENGTYEKSYKKSYITILVLAGILTTGAIWSTLLKGVPPLNRASFEISCQSMDALPPSGQNGTHFICK